MALSTNTNERLFLDGVAEAKAMRALDQQTRAIKERFYLLGIANDPANGGQTPVDGFEEAFGLPKSAVAGAASLAVEFQEWLDANGGARRAAWQTILINEPA